jgi:phosphoserine aminotransferase
MLWDFIDNSNGYYKSKLVNKNIRSRINVIFRIQGGNEKLEAEFMKEAKEWGII